MTQSWEDRSTGTAVDGPPTEGRSGTRIGSQRGSGRRRPLPRRRRVARIAAVTAASLVLVTAGAGAWLYHHLNGNLSTVSLAMGGKSVGGTEKADPFGRTPINLLVIGSDARSNAEDCR